MTSEYGHEREAQLRRDFARVHEVLAGLTGLPSHWNGEVQVMHGVRFLGSKPFSCAIRMNAILADDPLRWRTLIHEALHAFSAGYVRADYEALPGWEEGTVEQLQRLLRPIILARLGVDIDTGLFDMVEEEHAYNGYIAALESLRVSLDASVERFYLDLLATPIRNRPASVLARGMLFAGAERVRFVALYSAADSVLKGATL